MKEPGIEQNHGRKPRPRLAWSRLGDDSEKGYVRSELIGFLFHPWLLPAAAEVTAWTIRLARSAASISSNASQLAASGISSSSVRGASELLSCLCRPSSF